MGCGFGERMRGFSFMWLDFWGSLPEVLLDIPAGFVFNLARDKSG